MKRKWSALLAAALALSMLGTGALAAPAGDVPQSGTAAARPDAYVPDPEGRVSFGNLERRMREGNLNLLALEENIQFFRAYDYDEMTEDARKGLNEIANRQWQMISAGSAIPDIGIPNPDGTMTPIPGINQALSGISFMVTSSMVQQLQATYDGMREQFDKLKSGEFQADMEDLIWQLENTQDQVVMAGQSLYIALISLEQNSKTIDRGLATIDRTLTELELRHQLGQVSTRTLEQARASRTSLVSSQETLNSNIKTLKYQLEMFLGAQFAGTIQLDGLPQVTAEQIQAMDLDRDLADAKRASYSLYEAKQALDDAREDFEDSGKQYNHNDKHYEYVQAKHQWQAAQHSYDATVQDFERGLRALYLKVKDDEQVLQAAKEALAVEQGNYAVAQLKHEQGSLSANGLLEAEDKVKQALETADSAAVELFSAYNSYRWAVDRGILNT